MRTVSNDFKNAMKAPVREINGKLILDAGVDEITSTDDLVKFTVEGEATRVGKSALRKLTAEYLGTRNIVGQTITVQFGVKLPNDTIEYCDLGEFLVTQCETSKERETTILTGFDKLIYSIIPYQNTGVEYPTTLGEYYGLIVEQIGLTIPDPTTIPMNTLALEEDLYENIRGTQYRHVIEDIAVLGGQIAMINESNELELRSIKTPTNTVETLSYDDLKKLKIKTKYGVVNSLVLSRQPQEDNVVLQNETSVDTDGLTEIKIINNEIVDKRREDVATDIFTYYDQIEYYPFEADTIGLGWFEVGDKLNIIDDEAVTREVRVMGVKLTIDGGIKETIRSEEPTKTETNYQRAGGLDDRLKNTEIVVDKQEQEIASIVEQVTTIDGHVNEEFSRIDQDIANVVTSVQQSGGSNLIRNSAFFSYDTDNVPDFWDAYNAVGNGEFFASPEAVSFGSISGHVVLLNNIGYEQRVPVVQGNPSDPEDQKTYYSFSCRVKKETVGVAKVILTDGTNTWEEEFTAGTSKLWEEISFEKILPQNTYIDVKIEGDGDAQFEVTDLMLIKGEYETNWQQANGEVMNTQVNIHSKGITVKSSVFLGDYTVISPLEFSGYANIDGTPTRVFTLNKDVTEVTRLQSEKEITMHPVKVVPINTSTNEGWAFVKSGGEE